VLAPRGKNASPIIVPAYQLLFPSIRGFKTWDNPFAPDYQNIDGALGGFLGFWAVLMQAGFSFFGSEVPGIAAGEFGLETDTVQSSKQINRGSDQCDGRKYDFHRLLLDAYDPPECAARLTSGVAANVCCWTCAPKLNAINFALQHIVLHGKYICRRTALQKWPQSWS
jgi:hypothetical protein